MIRRFKKQPVEEASSLDQPQKKVKILRWSDVGPRRIKPAAEADPRFTLPLEQRRSTGSR